MILTNQYFSLGKLYLLVIGVFLTAFFANLTFAQSPSSPSVSEAEKKYNLIFPIAELGNCTNLEECKAYCSDKANQEACVSFAKKKGFHKENNSGQGNARSRLLLQKAAEELGCSSEQECKEICQEEENRGKCQAFAKKYSLNTNAKNPSSSEMIEKAKAILGCDSPQSCKEVCSKEENREKCSQFAKVAGLKGGIERVGPGGCKSETGCKEFCSNSDNFDKCQGFKERLEQQRELEKKCQESPQECKKKKEEFQAESLKKREELCKENPEKCKELGGPNIKAFENANDRARFCRENPEKCTKNLEGRPPSGSPSGSFQKPSMIQPFEGKPRPDPANLNKPPLDQEIKRLDADIEELESEVQGISTSRSFVQTIVDFFLGR